MKKKDPQRRRVYEWAWAWFDWNRATISFDEAKKLIRKACDAWDIHPPRYIHRLPRKTPYSIYDDGHLSLGLTPEHMNPAMVLHELAHHIVHVRYGTRPQDHGPEWLGVYVDLLAAFKVAPEDALTASLRKRKLKFELPKGRTVLK